MKITTDSFTQTEAVGVKIAKSLRGGEVLCLMGDLGGGKTCFTKGLARGLGVREEITSPTFVLRKDYMCGDHSVKHLYHFDVYRLKGDAGTESLGLVEAMNDPNGVTVVEWGERIENLLPKSKITVKFTYQGESTRQIEINDWLENSDEKQG